MLNPAQLQRVASMRANGASVDTTPIPDYPNWVSVSLNGRGFFARIPVDGSKVDRIADWLD